MRGSIRASGTAERRAADMTTTPMSPAAGRIERPSVLTFTRRMIRKQPLGFAGGLIVLLMVLMAVFAEVVAPFDPTANSFEHMSQPPSWQFLLGTDQFGRDIFRSEERRVGKECVGTCSIRGSP